MKDGRNREQYNHPRDKGLPQILEGYPGFLGLDHERTRKLDIDTVRLDEVRS